MALTVVPVLAYFLVDKVEPRRRRVRRAEALALDPALRPGDPLGPQEPLDEGRDGRSRPASCSSLSTSLVSQLPTAFIDSGSEKIVQVTIAPPSGASSEQVLERAEQAEEILLADPDVELVATSLPGRGRRRLPDDPRRPVRPAAQQRHDGRPPRSETVDLQPKIDELADRPRRRSPPTATRSPSACRAARRRTASASSSAPRTPMSSPRRPQAVEAALAEEPGLTNVTSDLVEAAPEVQVRVDPNRAIGVGFTTAQVGAEIRSRADADDRRAHPGRRRGSGRPRVPPRCRGASTRSTPSGRCRSGSTVKVPLSAIADVDEAEVQSRITRINEAPSATISAVITSGDTGATSIAVQGVDRRAPRRTGRSRPAPRSRSVASSPSRPRRSAACSPRWASRSCSST